MGIVARQGIKAGIVLYIGVVLGALNNIWFYPQFLAPEQIGVFRLLLANEIFLATLFQLGAVGIIDKFFTFFKDTARDKGAFLKFSLLYPLIGLSIFIGLYFLLPDLFLSAYKQKSPNIIKYYYVLPVLVFLITYNGILMAFSRAYFRIVVPQLLENVLLRTIVIILLLLLSWRLITFYQFIWGFVGIRLLNCLILTLYLQKLIPGPINWKSWIPRAKVKEFIQFATYITLGTTSGIIISNADIIMIGSYLGERDTGIYTIAFFIGTVVEIPRRAIAQISVPVISEAWKNNHLHIIKDIYQKTSVNLMIAGALLALLIFFNVQDLFAFMPKGEVYRQGIYVVVFISIARFVDMTSGANQEILLYSKYYRFTLFSNLILAVMVIGTNALLIPIYQLNGAALATLISIIIYNFIRFAFLLWKFKIQPFNQKTIWTLALIGLTAMVGYALSFIQIHPIVNIAIKSIGITSVFIAGVWILKLSEDISLFAQKLMANIKQRLKQ